MFFFYLANTIILYTFFSQHALFCFSSFFPSYKCLCLWAAFSFSPFFGFGAHNYHHHHRRHLAEYALFPSIKPTMQRWHMLLFASFAFCWKHYSSTKALCWSVAQSYPAGCERESLCKAGQDSGSGCWVGGLRNKQRDYG